MSLFTTLFGPGNPRPASFPDAQTCPHTRLLARYRNHVALEAERPMGYKCQRCNSEFLPNSPTAARFRAASSEARQPATEAEPPAEAAT